WLDDVV
ncbi:hypothetical protein THAOC_13773, partial [Thalassiosira oceanica]